MESKDFIVYKITRFYELFGYNSNPSLTVLQETF